MLATDTQFLDVLLPAAIHLHEAMVEEGATTPAAIEALLARLAPDLDADASRFVLRLATWVAFYTQHVIDEALSNIIHAADPTLALGAFSVQSKWAAFDLRVCRRKHADDPDKDRLRDEEVEYFRAKVAGMPFYAFGRLFREQLAKDPPHDSNEEDIDDID
ncbi:hypothetical protein [Methylobacterium segetis]|uniref:hypothetical protein n=1 Tax=Methylobacterium segetis TaxID=2488750 RepID=UPI0010536946|nr:hypothetical protein [Methylobacterium segetis]